MNLTCRRAVLAMLLFISIFANPTRGQDYYSGLTYGSEAMFTPLQVLINNGYDILQLGNRPREILELPYTQASANVWNSVTHPRKTITEYGVHKFISNELFPLSFSIKGMQWWPNYNGHFIGGGMTYRKLVDWYKYHHYPKPKIFGLVTTAAYHYLHEVVENHYYEGYNADAVADLLFFNLGGVILFSNDRVARFFRKKLYMSDWSSQPSFDLSGKTLQNSGQHFTIKADLPFSRTWQLFYTFGMDGVLGLTYRIDREYAVSFGGGFIRRELVDVDKARNVKTVKLIGTLGFYYDRNNSLLASLKIGNHIDYQAVVNVYPGIIKIGKFSPGVWAALDKNGKSMIGISTIWIPGLAIKN